MQKKIINKITKILILLMIAILLFQGLDEEEKKSKTKITEKINEELDKYIKTADNVETNMLTADYWINKQDNPDEIIMPPIDIAIWNEQYGTGRLEKEEMAIAYAYTVQRADIRKEPTSKFVPIVSGDQYFCEMQVSSILINEPVVVLKESEDGQWYYIKCRYCEGWIEKKSVALCENYEQWIANMKPENFLLITGNKVILDIDAEHPLVSEIILYMGTKLELIEYEYYISTENGRVPYECYIVKVPIRDEEEMLDYSYAFVPVSKDVHIGYLPYTARNLLTQMFKLNGDRYGWGGMFNARDCSQYVMEIYSLFGFEFFRNSGAQAQMNFEGYNMDGATDREKKKLLDKTPIGSILYFEGHVMLYLGKVEDEYYVISETARIAISEEAQNEIENAHSCMITTLDILRPNGCTWLESLSVIKIVQ